MKLDKEFWDKTAQGDKASLMTFAAVKLADDPDFFAFVFREYLLMTGNTPDALMDQLGCTPENYWKLALCKVPDDDAPDYLDRVRRIAEYVEIRDADIMGLIRLDGLVKKVKNAIEP